LGPQDLDIDARFDHEEIESQTCIITFLIRYGNTTETCFNKGLFLHHGFVVKLLNDLFGIQARGGCACAGPLAHHLLGLQQGQVKEIQTCLTFSGHEVFCYYVLVSSTFHFL
jgi:selenocysteine lyase/cysteine desulfurase